MTNRPEFWTCPQLRRMDAAANETDSFWHALDTVADLIGLPLRPELGRVALPANWTVTGPQVFHPDLVEVVLEAIGQKKLTLPQSI